MPLPLPLPWGREELEDERDRGSDREEIVVGRTVSSGGEYPQGSMINTQGGEKGNAVVIRKDNQKEGGEGLPGRRDCQLSFQDQSGIEAETVSSHPAWGPLYVTSLRVSPAGGPREACAVWELTVGIHRGEVKLSDR